MEIQEQDPATVTGESWIAIAQSSSVSRHPRVLELISQNPAWIEDRLIPKRVTIETFFGCNAQCTMCVIDFPTPRKKGIMSMDLFRQVVDRLVPYQDHIEMMDLTALGEPLLDKHLFERIRYLKEKGFRRLAFATNADLLTQDKRHLLLESGIDTVMFSIDGIRKETHEAIRVGVDYDNVVNNCLYTIKMRDDGGYKTRFLVRFVRQTSNWEEWEPYKKFWKSHLSPERGDQVACYDMHTWGGNVESKEALNTMEKRNPEIEIEPCHHVFNKLTILADGSVPLCSEDILAAQFDFGNANDTPNPIDLFNASRLRAMRALHLAGKKDILKICQECTILYSERTRAFE